MKRAFEWIAEELIGCRKWPAHFSVDQMRAQIAHEQAGCPAPFPGAVWDGFCYVGGDRAIRERARRVGCAS